jgi:hypothetical protein
MAVNFPASPTNGQTFTSGGITWTYSTSVGAWEIVPSSIQGVQGIQGIQGIQSTSGFQGIQGTTGGGGGGGAAIPLIIDAVNATRYLVFANNTTGNLSSANVDTGLTFNPSSNTLSVNGSITVLTSPVIYSSNFNMLRTGKFIF